MKKISASGMYDLTDTEYHSDCCDGPSISASGLKQILDKGPAKYWLDSYLNPDRPPEESKPHFRIGKAAHMLLLEPERVMQHVAKIPADILAKNGAASTAAAKEFIFEAEAEGKVCVKPVEWEQIIAMRDAIAAHPHARRALIKGRAEQSMIYFDEPSGVYIKSRPDFLPDRSGQYIVDYKTTADLKMWERQATLDLRYDMQAAICLWLAHEVAGVEPKGILYLVQEKSPPYTVGMLTLTIDDLTTRSILNVARMDVRKALESFATCLDAKRWPTGYEHPREIHPPEWHVRQIEYKTAEATVDFKDDFAI